MEMVSCIVPVSPMRKESAHRSEMVSQLLFGETAEILEKTKDFYRVRGMIDNYEGWCQRGQLAETDNASEWKQHVSAEWVSTIQFNGQPMHIPLGSSLGMLENKEGKIGKYAVTHDGPAHDISSAKISGEAIINHARQYLNTPYLWGGRSSFGIDCSGLAQQVFRYFSKPLPRDSYQQAEEGELVGFLQEAKQGDLAFFDNEEGKIIHVGILIDTETIIHSSVKVRIDRIDSSGIINTDTGERTHRLRIIRRIF